MIDRRALLSALGSGLAGMLTASRSQAEAGQTVAARETCAVLGTGKLGGTLGTRLAQLGYPVIYGSRTPDSASVRSLVAQSGAGASATSPAAAAARSAIVVFALPWEPARDLLPTLGPLTGKLVIDPMNTKLTVVAGYPQRPESAASVAEQLQAGLPGAHVVKAFNTILYRNLADPARAGGPISIPLAGADDPSRERVAQLVTALGLDPVDMGPLIAARYIEDMLRFEVGYVIHNKGKKMFELYMRPVPV